MPSVGCEMSAFVASSVVSAARVAGWRSVPRPAPQPTFAFSLGMCGCALRCRFVAMLRVFPESQVIFGLLHKFVNKLKAAMAKDPQALNKLKPKPRVVIKQQVEMAVTMLMQTSCFPSKAKDAALAQHTQLTQVLESYVMDCLYDGVIASMREELAMETRQLRNVLLQWTGRTMVRTLLLHWRIRSLSVCMWVMLTLDGAVPVTSCRCC